MQLIFVWPPYFCWWDLDYSDGSYVTAIVVCFWAAVREQSVLPAGIRTVLMSHLHTQLLRPTRPSLHVRASLSSLVCADGLRPWRLKVARISPGLVYFLPLSWHVFSRGICWKQNRRRDIAENPKTRFWSFVRNTSDDFWNFFQFSRITFISASSSAWSSDGVHMHDTKSVFNTIAF